MECQHRVVPNGLVSRKLILAGNMYPLRFAGQYCINRAWCRERASRGSLLTLGYNTIPCNSWFFGYLTTDEYLIHLAADTALAL